MYLLPEKWFYSKQLFDTRTVSIISFLILDSLRFFKWFWLVYLSPIIQYLCA